MNFLAILDDNSLNMIDDITEYVYDGDLVGCKIIGSTSLRLARSYMLDVANNLPSLSRCIYSFIISIVTRYHSDGGSDDELDKFPSICNSITRNGLNITITNSKLSLYYIYKDT